MKIIKIFNKCIQSTYNWMKKSVKSPYALWILATISFIESSFFPIPPDILLIPLVLYRRKEAFKIAFITTLSSVLGGFFGYGIGYFLYSSIGVALLNFYHYTEQFEKFCSYYNEYGAWIVFGAGLTPFPYKIVTIASGVTHLNLWVFGIASFIARGVRFYLVSFLLWKYGRPMQDYIERNLGWLSIVFFTLLVGCFFLIGLF